MNIVRQVAMPPGSARFDALRARLEVDLGRPAVIAITSSTQHDGRATVARGLAFSLATAGYMTLFVDTAAQGRSRLGPGQTFEEIAHAQVAGAASPSGIPAVLTLSDQALQRTVSRRSLQAGLDLLSDRYEFIIVCAEFNESSPFVAGILASAHAVVATVQTGRRAAAADTRLAAELARAGSRFLGLVTLDAALARDESANAASDAVADAPRSPVGHVDNERPRREIVESAT